MKKVNIQLAVAILAAIASIVSFAIFGNPLAQTIFLVIEWLAIGTMIGMIKAKTTAKTTTGKKEESKTELKKTTPTVNPNYAALVAEHDRIHKKIITLSFALKHEHYYRYTEDKQIAIITEEKSYYFESNVASVTRRIFSLNGKLIEKFPPSKAEEFKSSFYCADNNYLPKSSEEIIENKLKAKLVLLEKKLIDLAEEISNYILNDVDLNEADEANETDAPYRLDASYIKGGDNAAAAETLFHDGVEVVAIIAPPINTGSNTEAFVTHMPV